MSTRDRWLDAGIELLAGEGPSAVRIDRLARRIGLSKGSFFHHFAGAAAFKTALLGRLEAAAAEVWSASAERLSSATPRELLVELTDAVGTSDLVVWRPEVQVALRSWALQDAEVRETQTRIDRAALDLLESVWRRIGLDPQSARVHALLPYLIMVGAGMSTTPIERPELHQVYELILPLVPATPVALRAT
jgi:AcrR family transcriptional regulator